MIKKSVIVIFCLSIVSAALWSWAATTWQLQTKLNNAGGTIKVRNNATQTAVGTVVYTNFTTAVAIPVSVAANSGYKISSLTKSGSPVTIGNYTSHYSTTFQKSGGTTQSLVAGFTAQQLVVTGTVVGPGTISPASSSVTYGGTVVLSASPASGGSILTSVTGGSSVADLYGNPVTLPFAAPVKITVSNVTGPRSVTATYTSVSVNAGVNQISMINSLVTLHGTMVGGGNLSWSQIGGPVTTLAGATTLTPTFTPTSVGTYLFQLTESLSDTVQVSATTQVSVVDSLVNSMRLDCMGCHASNGVYPTPYVFSGWSSSTHKATGVSCVTCHTDGAMPTPINSSVVDSSTFAFKSPGTGSYCLNGTCHTPGLIHNTVGMTCANCHGNYKNHNPNTTFSAALNVCFNCHGAVNTTHFYTATYLTTDQCTYCHNPSGHNPLPSASVSLLHFNGYTSYANPNYGAAYVTPSTQCANCHKGGDPTSASDLAIKQFRQDWAGSGHGDIKGAPWINSATHNWKSSGLAGAKVSQMGFASGTNDCQRCHTAAGYVQFTNTSSINPINAAAPKYSEPLTCNACHNADFSIRSVSARSGYYNYTSANTKKLLISYAYPNELTSNICLGCHVGREAGDTIKAMAAATAHKNYSTSFWQNVSFVNSHYLTAGGQVFGVTGYEYPGQSYSNTVDHSRIGAGLDGPCVTCHMPNSTHTLNPAAAGYTLCNTCHEGAGVVNSTFVAQKTADFTAALQALANALTSKGFTPNIVGGVLTYPYFTNMNWGNKDAGPGNMGAAFNYNLLVHDPGAFAHNPTYAKRLVRDSIDYLTNNGTVDRSRDLTGTINSLLSNSTDRADANTFLTNAANGSAACTVCHSAAVDPLTGDNIVADYEASKHATQPRGATCGSCHAPTQTVAHPSAQMFTAAADLNARCLTTGCHIYPPVAGYSPGPGTEHTWDSIGKCITCHNGHKLTATVPFPHLSNYTTAQFITTNFNDCKYCHNQVDQLGNSTFFIYSTHYEFARSGKGNPNSPSYTALDFKTMGTPAPATPANSASAIDCVRCHTTTGYINYVSSNFTDIRAWGISGLLPGGDRTREMIQCAACHDPTPFKSYDTVTYPDPNDPTVSVDVPAFSRRDVPAVTAYYNYSSAGSKKSQYSFTFGDYAETNNCIACHSGTVAGKNLGLISGKVGLTGGYWNNASFIAPHPMGAAGILFGGASNSNPSPFFTMGFHYRTTSSYYPTNNFSHYTLGDGVIGPCVVCHMETTKPHLFMPVSTASNGAITKITAMDAVCSECHNGGALDWTNPANLEAKRLSFVSSLKTLAAALIKYKGIYFNPNQSPYFFTDATYAVPFTNWGDAYTMGAAFNLQLLWTEKGAFAHNDVYTKRLIYDSIDYLDDGNANNSTVFTAIQNLPDFNSPGFTLNATDRTNAQGYITPRK